MADDDDKNITFKVVEDTELEIDYAIEVEGGPVFVLGFSRDVLDVWEAQLSRSGRTMELDPIADGLAGILQQEPTEEQLNEGFLVTMDNGFATPTAAEQNLKNSGVLPFLAHRENLESPHPPAMPL